jgi:hypothetical protein
LSLCALSAVLIRRRELSTLTPPPLEPGDLISFDYGKWGRGTPRSFSACRRMPPFG